MAGTSNAFNSTVFRTKIRAAMQMGLPQASADQATFRWNPVKTYASEDTAAHPYLWNATPVTSTQHPDVKVDCAVQVHGGNSSEEFTSVGELNPLKVEITLLDVDYTQIIGADLVLLGQKAYQIDFVAPPVGLFDVTVYTLFATALDV